MTNFLRKKLHLCFSSSGVLSPAIPSSPVVKSTQHPPPHHSPSIFVNNFNSLYDHLSVSSPLHRSNIVDHEEEEEEEEENEAAMSRIFSGGMAMMKNIESSDPYRDFGTSMREMVEARDLNRDIANDREYLHALLFCYLSLNPKHTHKYIVSAFADTLLWFLSPYPSMLSSPENSLPQSI